MLTTKQRAHLRGLANTLKPLVTIGKGEITDNILAEIENALWHNELVKVTALESVSLTAREMCEFVCEHLLCEPVQCVGRKFVIYRRTRKKDFMHIRLPQA